MSRCHGHGGRLVAEVSKDEVVELCAFSDPIRPDCEERTSASEEQVQFPRPVKFA